ncbi:hypothetical protein BFL28_19805 [Sphingomonas turrisvirgatae]|uniref:LPXTG cell wall anchor domain-containing protein n=1 Tax=Sphingomonas turrisvirgatae TaxID=1888892 RepID=A0A1E3LSJ2_9SPHN|nr:hypothetical protein BFL28_19805 [Sphingomonas turrisvirgatae]
MAPAPAPAPATQAPTATQSRTTIAPGVVEQAEQEARERAAAQRAATPQRSAPAARAAPVARVASSAPAAVTPAATAPTAPAAPATDAPEQPAPAATAPVAPAEPVAPAAETPPQQQQSGDSGTLWLVLAGLGAIAAAIAAMKLLRRRRDEDVYEDAYVDESAAAEPVYEPEPERIVHPAPAPMVAPAAAAAAAAPAFGERPVEPTPRHEPEVHAALESATLHRPDSADIDAVLGGAEPQGNRPQLELAMRPLRAGVTRNEGVVEFELTVANAGGVAAQDVRIGAFMLNGAAQDSAMERLLTNPPADAVVAADAIAPGDGTRVDAAVTLPREAMHDQPGHDGFAPIVLADARYRLPDGSEGRTAAAFTVGRTDGGDTLIPIGLDDGPAMYEDIEARLHSVPAKV